jgi:hypothetical protein
VASKAVGPTYGAVKRADLVVVKMEPDEEGERISSLIRGLSMIGQDIQDRGLKGRAVINMSVGINLVEWTGTGKWTIRHLKPGFAYSNKNTP